MAGWSPTPIPDEEGIETVLRIGFNHDAGPTPIPDEEGIEKHASIIVRASGGSSATGGRGFSRWRLPTYPRELRVACTPDRLTAMEGVPATPEHESVSG